MILLQHGSVKEARYVFSFSKRPMSEYSDLALSEVSFRKQCTWASQLSVL